jgi:hypothetical protein
MNQQISATIVADSIGPKGDRITTFLLVFPRFILAELNTHRMFSRNSASSRAIPFKKMIKAIQDDPFIPIAWQKDHSGMQGNEYFTDGYAIENLRRAWKEARDVQIELATAINVGAHTLGVPVTKQVSNRLLEAFMWHTALVTSTEFENFFSLRCPQYYFEPSNTYYRSKKDWIKEFNQIENGIQITPENNNVDWYKLNKGQAEIHMMALAEAMWDAYNAGKPQELKAGEWHIPYQEKIDEIQIMNMYDDTNGDPEKFSEGANQSLLDIVHDTKIAISTAMCARTSYTTVGDEKEVSYERLIQIHDGMYNQNPFHASPFEHIAQAMNNEEYFDYNKGRRTSKTDLFPQTAIGWCDNFRGFISYRHIVERERRNHGT